MTDQNAKLLKKLHELRAENKHLRNRVIWLERNYERDRKPVSVDALKVRDILHDIEGLDK